MYLGLLQYLLEVFVAASTQLYLRHCRGPKSGSNNVGPEQKMKTCGSRTSVICKYLLLSLLLISFTLTII